MSVSGRIAASRAAIGLLAVLLFTGLVSGCASSRGFDRGAVLQQMQESLVLVDEDVADVLALKPQLPTPFRVGVYFVPPGSPETPWLWRGEDKDAVLAIEASLRQKGIVSSMFTISGSTVQGPSLRSLRVAAARHGADALLVVTGGEATDRYNNALGVFYMFLVPMAFVPGSELDALFMANGVLWDVRNGYLYASAEAEATAHQTRPAMFIEPPHAFDGARTEAMAKLAQELEHRLAALAGS
jgi:rhombotail lipoprotein